MGDNSNIEWTEATWNWTTGCDRASPGCDHCYAMTLAKRLKAMGQANYQTDGDPRTSGPGFGVSTHPDMLLQPLRWKRPRMIFGPSMGDPFHADVPDEFIAQAFAVMGLCPQHTFQVLTKRHARMRSLLSSPRFMDLVLAASADLSYEYGRPRQIMWPFTNVWLGVSAEDQKWFDIRWAALERTPAAIRFVSAEPLLGRIDMAFDHECGDPPHMGCPLVPDWVIVGGESGPGARPMELDWAREIVKQCRWNGIPPFVKQLGAIRGRELGIDSHGGDWDRWPADLRVREYPQAVTP